MNAGSLLFAFSSALCLAGALVVILARSPIRSAMGLLATIGGITGLFLRLNAQFLAAIQLLVYAGAVVILFVFVIMLLGPSASLSDRGSPATLVSRGLAAVAMGLMGILGLSLVAGRIKAEQAWEFQTIGPEHGSIEAVGGMIFGEGLVAFELATALLIVAVIGAIAVARTKPVAKKKQENDHATLRLFHGPLMARDAQRPLAPGEDARDLSGAGDPQKEPTEPAKESA